MKQTAVEFYAIETGKLEVERAKGFLTFSQMFDKMLSILNEAKEMEKEQIKDAWLNSLTKGDYNSAEQYYNETFKSE